MKKQLCVKWCRYVLIVSVLSLSACGQKNQTAQETPAPDTKPVVTDSATSEEPTPSETSGTSATPESKPKPASEPPKENEVLNISGTLYKTNDKLFIITEAKSKQTVPPMEQTPFNVTLRISNKGQEEMVYHSWTPLESDKSPDAKRAFVADDQGNQYPIIPAKQGQPYEGQVREKTLKPDEAVKDLLLFSELKPGTKRIALHLPGNEFNGYKDLIFHFQLP